MTTVKMNYLKKVFAVALALSLWTSEGIAGGGWTRKPQSLYTKVGFNWLSSNQFFTRDGFKLETAPFYLRTLDLYAEYGLHDRLTAQLNFPLARSARFETSESATGIGDLSLELKYGLWQGDFPVALSVGVDVPTGNPNAIGRLNGNFGGFIRLPTGDGEWNIWTRTYISHSFYPIPMYASLDLGFNLRTQGFTNQYAAGVELGYKPLDALWVVSRVRRLALIGTPNTGVISAIGLGEGVEFNSISIGVAYSVTAQLSITADANGGFGVLKNIYSAPTFNMGVAFEL
jgi:hypothetical protein